MLEHGRETRGVAAELIGMFAPSVGWGLRWLARAIGADLLVVGFCARRRLTRVLRGDNAPGHPERRHLPRGRCPARVRGAAKTDRLIGVAYDGSPESDRALAAARVLATYHGAALRAARAVWPTSAMLPPVRHLPLAGALVGDDD